MAESGNRSSIIFIAVGVLLIGALFAGLALTSNSNDSLVANQSQEQQGDQGEEEQEQPTPPSNDDQPESQDDDTGGDAQREAEERERREAEAREQEQREAEERDAKRRAEAEKVPYFSREIIVDKKALEEISEKDVRTAGAVLADGGKEGTVLVTESAQNHEAAALIEILKKRTPPE